MRTKRPTPLLGILFAIACVVFGRMVLSPSNTFTHKPPHALGVGLIIIGLTTLIAVAIRKIVKRY